MKWRNDAEEDYLRREYCDPLDGESILAGLHQREGIPGPDLEPAEPDIRGVEDGERNDDPAGILHLVR